MNVHVKKPKNVFLVESGDGPQRGCLMVFNATFKQYFSYIVAVPQRGKLN
jgi:hypothetical protein